MFSEGQHTSHARRKRHLPVVDTQVCFYRVIRISHYSTSRKVNSDRSKSVLSPKLQFQKRSTVPEGVKRTLTRRETDLLANLR